MKVYLVGGAVRDALLGERIHERDWVVFGSTPDALLKLGYQQVGRDFPVFLHPETKEECALALKEISRVSKKYSFITVDAYRNNEEKKRMFQWNLTAKTIMSVEEWISFFKKVNYLGDYYWFIP